MRARYSCLNGCLAVAAVVLLGCSRQAPPEAAANDPCADPAKRDSINCKIASAAPPSADEKYVFSYQFFCEKDGDRSRSLNVTYRSAKSCDDAKAQADAGPDPCAEFAAEKWPGWRTWQRAAVYEAESCD